MRKTDISINIELDENHVPEKMNWNAPDGGVNNEETKAMLLSVWDDKAKEALRIDLWTKDMTQDDMKRFFHQIFTSCISSFSTANSVPSSIMVVSLDNVSAEALFKDNLNVPFSPLSS